VLLLEEMLLLVLVFFDGDLDEVTLWDRFLSEDEIRSIVFGGQEVFNISQSFIVTSDGLVGVGTQTPEREFDVVGDSVFHGDVRILGVLTGGSPVKIEGGLNLLSGDLNSSGDIIGRNITVLGTLSGGSPLQVDGGLVVTDNNGTSNAATIKMKATGVHHALLSFFKDNVRKWVIMNDGDSNDRLKIKSTDSSTKTRLTISQDGNIGINTDSPQSSLDIVGNVRYRRNAVNTISSTGVLTYNYTYMKVDTFNGEPSDQITDITGGVIGDMLILQSDSSSRDITVVDGGNIKSAGNFILSNVADKIVLIKATSTEWHEISRSNNN